VADGGFGVAPFFVRRELLDRVRPIAPAGTSRRASAAIGISRSRTQEVRVREPAFGEVYLLGRRSIICSASASTDRGNTVALTDRLRAGLVERDVQVSRRAARGRRFEFLREAVA